MTGIAAPGGRGVLRRALRPSVLLPVALSVALLAALFTLGNSAAIVSDIFTFHPRYLLWFVALMLVYEAGRAAQWHFLLHTLGVRVPWRRQALAFFVGEAARSLPLGNYLPNYVLRHSDAVAYGRSSVATTAIVLFEVIVALAAVAVLGLGDWAGWVRTLVVGGVLLAIPAVWAARRLRGRVALPGRIRGHRGVQALLREARAFGAGARCLARPHVVAVGLLLCAIYLAAAGMALYAVARGLGLETVAPWQVLAVYCFSLAAALIEPSPLDIGVIEVGGVAAFLALGVPADRAISAMLINRVLSVVIGLLIAGAGMIVLRREFRALGRRHVAAPDALAA